MKTFLTLITLIACSIGAIAQTVCQDPSSGLYGVNDKNGKELIPRHFTTITPSQSYYIVDSCGLKGVYNKKAP